MSEIEIMKRIEKKLDLLLEYHMKYQGASSYYYRKYNEIYSDQKKEVNRE